MRFADAVRPSAAQGCDSATVSLSLEGSSLEANHADGAGGALAVSIAARGLHVSSVLRRCNLTENTVGVTSGAFAPTASSGGAVFVWLRPSQQAGNADDTSAGCSLEATGCGFMGNLVSGGSGGAVAAVGCPMLLRECSFSRNSAALSGGAVTAIHVGRSPALTFASVANTGSGSGAGALSPAMVLPLQNAGPARRRSLQASAQGPGGVSTARLLYAARDGSGAGIRTAAAAVSAAQLVEPKCVVSLWQAALLNCTFEGNTAQVRPRVCWRDGSAVGGHKTRSPRARSAHTACSRASRLRCPSPTAQLEFGGAVYMDAATQGQALLANSTLLNNRAAGQHGGGAMLVATGSCAGVGMVNTSVEGNAAALANAGGAYLLASTGGRAVLDRSNLTANRAAGSGGGAVLDARGGGVVTAARVAAAGNAAGAAGGGLALFAEGSAAAGAGSGKVTLSSSALSSNTASQGGGAALVAGCGAHAHLGDVLAEGNVASAWGGGLHVDYRSASQPASTESLGASRPRACADGSAASVAGGRLVGNLAGLEGGGLFLSSSSALTAAGLAIDGNEAGTGGGGVAARECASLQLDRSNVTRCNVTAGPGGGLMAVGCGRLLLQFVALSANSASHGGGVFIGELPAAAASAGPAGAATAAITTALLHRTVFHANQALAGGSGGEGGEGDPYDGFGGALFAERRVALALTQSRVTASNAAPYGSAIASTQSCSGPLWRPLPEVNAGQVSWSHALWVGGPLSEGMRGAAGGVAPACLPAHGCRLARLLWQAMTGRRLLTPVAQPADLNPCPSQLTPLSWSAAFAMLDAAASQRCWPLAISNTILPAHPLLQATAPPPSPPVSRNASLASAGSTQPPPPRTSGTSQKASAAAFSSAATRTRLLSVVGRARSLVVGCPDTHRSQQCALRVARAPCSY